MRDLGGFDQPGDYAGALRESDYADDGASFGVGGGDGGLDEGFYFGEEEGGLGCLGLGGWRGGGVGWDAAGGGGRPAEVGAAAFEEGEDAWARVGGDGTCKY